MPRSFSDRPTAIRRSALVVLRFFLPCPCLACNRPIGEWRPILGLCVPCRGRLRRPQRSCAQCGAPLATPELPSGFRCGGCRQAPPAFAGLRAAYLYEPPLDDVVRGLKFGGLAYLGRHAAELITRLDGPHLGHAEIVVPVPLHWSRRVARGYNQADEISRPLARALAIPHLHCLRRARRTAPQTHLPLVERRANLVSAFRVRRRCEIEGRRVLLVDDVATTGATADAAAHALVAAGARSVHVAVLGRTPPPDARSTEDWQDS